MRRKKTPCRRRGRSPSTLTDKCDGQRAADAENTETVLVIMLMMIIAAAFIPIQLFVLTRRCRYSGRAVKAAVPSTFVRLMQVPLRSSPHIALHALALKCLRFNILTAFPVLSTFRRAQKRRRKKLRRIPPPLLCPVQPNSLHFTFRHCPPSCRA